MKRVVILIGFILLITGCSVNYNLIIHDDLSITEEAKLTGTSAFFNNYYKTTKTKVLESILEVYKDGLDNNNYKYELKEDEIPYVDVTREYNSINDYINDSKLFNGYFDEIKYTEDGNIKKIETVGFNDNEPDNPDRFDVNELQIAIRCPYKVKNHNAKRIDKSTNTYYYELSSENNKILFEYDVSSKFNPYSDVMRTVIICIIIIIAIWLTVFILNKNQNK